MSNFERVPECGRDSTPARCRAARGKLPGRVLFGLCLLGSGCASNTDLTVLLAVDAGQRVAVPAAADGGGIAVGTPAFEPSGPTGIAGTAAAPGAAASADLAAGSGAANAGAAGAMHAGSPEVCDGTDNDQNGIIDDVDAQGDGVCDCLNIATIGDIGPWSDGGNVFKTWLNSRSPTPAVELGDQILTDRLLAPFQVIVVLYVATRELSGNGRTLAAHHPFSEDEVAAFARWVRAGGGVMTTIGYTTNESEEVANVNRLLGPFGMGYSTRKVDLSGEIDEWQPHPLSAEIDRIFTQNGIEPDGPNGDTIARGGGDRVALQVSQPDTGHVVVWGDEWITYDSQWKDVKDQQVERFWLNILKWMSPPKVCQVPISPD